MKLNRNLKVGGAMVAGFLLLATFGPFVSPYDPQGISLEEGLALPSLQHPLGCDSNGADILSILLHGARFSLAISFFATLAAVSIGLVLGSVAGYFGGWKDALLSRIIDTFLAFPGFLLTVALASALGPSRMNLVLSLAATSWASYARIVRGEVLAIRGLEYVDAAAAIGVSPFRIVVRHIWPNLFSTLLVSVTYGLASTVIAEASLSFLGLGTPLDSASWGALLNFGRDVLVEAPHVALAPGAAIFLLVFGFHLLGEGVRAHFDPKSRQ